MADADGREAYKRSGAIAFRYCSRRSDTTGLSNPGGLFFTLVVLIVAALFLIYQLTQTLYQLHLAEGERDRWQRPDAVIESLKLKEGNVVADVGCGVGYFSLKLAPKVAERGTVLAEDILGESLTFLWIRAFLRYQSNIRVIHGNPDDPHLPQGSVDAVLIANSYHEFTKPLAMLDHTFRALRSDGRFVVLDRGPRGVPENPDAAISNQRFVSKRRDSPKRF